MSKKANTICVAYENLERFFPKGKMILTGNPVRQDIIDIESKREDQSTLIYNYLRQDNEISFDYKIFKFSCTNKSFACYI